MIGLVTVRCALDLDIQGLCMGLVIVFVGGVKTVRVHAQSCRRAWSMQDRAFVTEGSMLLFDKEKKR
jgi:hypothetical protein